MRISLPYGDATIAAELTGIEWLKRLECADRPPPADGEGVVNEALANPIGCSADPCSAFRPGESVLIVVSDSFRATRADQMLPPLLKRLRGAGIAENDISFLVSTGTHRPPTIEEQKRIFGRAVYEQFAGHIHSHDAHDDAAHVLLGTTSRGTPVEIDRRAVDADRVIATGTAVLHYFGGFGGGRKSVFPGLASARGIAHNHAMNLHPTEDRLDPAVRIGSLDDNPVAEDMLEAARFVDTACILNTVLDPNGDILAVFAGELDAAHRAACECAWNVYTVPIAQRADLVIAASAHTRNFVQTHKALYNAHLAMRPGGRVVLAAPCTEGLGGEQFTQWLNLGAPDRVIAALRDHSEINGQTALSTLDKSPATYFVTDLGENAVHRLGGHLSSTLQNAVDTALADLRRDGCERPTTYLIPTAAYTVPLEKGAGTATP